jgi:hypothetical protein
MAEVIGLDVILGMDATQMQSELQKAQNLLRQFESQLKKSTDTVEITKLNVEIAKVSSTINNFNTAMQGAAKPTGDATQSLVNLSRVAQDAPYGFMGIANNLNPMLESFQRLQKESGGTGNALKALVSGLTGPAGLGLALGVVSSLVVAFGDDIGDFFSKLINGRSSLKEYTDSLHESQKAYVEAYVDMYKLKNAFDDYHNGLISQKELLKNYNDTLGDTYGKTNNVAEAEKVWAANSENFIKAAVLRAAAMKEIEKAAQKSAEAFETEQKPKEQFTSAFAFGGAGVGGASAINMQSQLDKQRKASQLEAVNSIREEEKFYLKVAESIEAQIKLLKEKDVLTQFAGKELPKEKKEKDYTLQDKIAQTERLIKLNEDLANEEMKQYQARQKFNKKDGTEIERADTGVSRFRNILNEQDTKREKQEKPDLLNKKLDKDLPKWAQEDDASMKKVDKDLKQAQKTATDFANTMSQEVTGGLMSMWDAMESGENPLQALGNFFKDLLKQLAAAVVQALIFQGIMSALGMGGVASGGGGLGGGLIGGISKIFGFAEGGIVSQPTLSMVGEGGQSEAIMPLNKLGNMMNSTFNAGAMSGQGGGGNGQFVLKGNDLVLAMQRSNFSLNVRR